MTGDEEELRAHVQMLVWAPVEPLFMAVARWLMRWLV